MTTAQQNGTAPGTDIELSQAIIEQFRDMVTVIPDAATDGGGERILAKIFEATTVESLEAPWTDDRAFPVGAVVVITDVHKRLSDFAGGLPFYMECECTDLETGEQVTYNTGSVSATAQVAMAFCNGWLPMTCKLVEAEKASKNGFYPQHFEVITDARPAARGKRRG